MLLGYGRQVDGGSGSPANATLSSFCLNPADSGRKNPPVPAIHVTGDDCCSRGLRPSRALPECFDGLSRLGEAVFRAERMDGGGKDREFGRN